MPDRRRVASAGSILAHRAGPETSERIRRTVNMKRMRGRNHRGGGSGGSGGGGGIIRNYSGNTPLNRNHVFDSQGPDLRLRGTAQQLFEKYLQLGRDATSSGDRVVAEGYFQHAEHYFRILGAMQAAQQQNLATQQGQAPQANGHGGQNGYRRYQGDDGEGVPGDEDGGDEPEQRASDESDQHETDRRDFPAENTSEN